MTQPRTIGDLFPVIDSFIATYQQHRNTLLLMFGGMTIDKAGEIIQMIRGFMK